MTQDPDRPRPADEPTVSLPAEEPEEPTPAERTVASWSLDELLAEPPPRVAPPVPPRRQPWVDRPHRPAYYVSLTVAVMLALGLVSGLAVLSVNRPVSPVAGTAVALDIPPLPSPTGSTTPGASATASSTASGPTAPAAEVHAELAAHPLSSSPARMAPLSCALPTFDPADTEQAAFYAAAKGCADAVFGTVLTEAGLATEPVEVVTVLGGPVQTPCGVVEPAAPATQCAGTVHMTPAWLRDVEANGRYPGRYLGVFLREYARAVQERAGLARLYQRAREAGADAADLELRAARQATCLAGAASGAMAGRGSVDDNITVEIRQRLTAGDAPADADTWLAEGFRSRQLAACDTWS